jgi:hypothetical protein
MGGHRVRGSLQWEIFHQTKSAEGPGLRFNEHLDNEDGPLVVRPRLQVARRSLHGYLDETATVTAMAVATTESWCEALLDVRQENGAVHRSIDYEWGDDPVVAQACDKGDRFPCPCGTDATRRSRRAGGVKLHLRRLPLTGPG